MAIHVETPTPRKLLSAYKKAIDEGHVQTWSYDTDGDFTHTPDQWRREAWFRPRIVDKQELVFFILSPVEETLSTEVYAVYHGRFIESLLSHCDDLFESARASSSPEDGDIVS